MSLFEDLYEAGIIDQSEFTQLKNQDHKSDSFRILEILYLFFEHKAFDEKRSGSSFRVNILAQEQGNESTEEVEVYSTLLEILYKNEIITTPVFQKLKKNLFENTKYGYFATIHCSREMMSFYHFFSTEKQLDFAKLFQRKDAFGSNGLINESQMKKLLSDIKAGKLETNLDFFKYCYGCRLIDLSIDQGKPQNPLKKATKILNDLCPAFHILKINTETADFIGEPTYHNKQITIFINTGDREHQQNFTFTQSKNSKENDARQLLQNLLTAINRLLADFHADYRIIGITNSLSEALFPGSKSQYAICRFTENDNRTFDFYTLQRRCLFNDVLTLSHRSPLSYSHISYALNHFSKCGLFKHLNKGTLDEIYKKLYESTYDHIGDLLGIFPDTLIFKPRRVDAGQQPFKDFIHALNKVSNGVLNFDKINDGTPEHFSSETESTFKISFIYNNQHHEIDCNLIYQEFDDSIIYYIINEIIRKEFADHQLIQLVNSNPTHDIFLFATKKQINYLKKMRLVEAIDRF